MSNDTNLSIENVYIPLSFFFKQLANNITLINLNTKVFKLLCNPGIWEAG